MLRRHHVIVLISSLATIPVFATGCSEDEPAVPQAIFQGRLERGATNCEDSTDLFTVGDFGNQNADPKVPSRAVADGAAEGQGTAQVTCAVTPSGPNEFDVSASLNLGGATGGLFSIVGKFKADGAQQTGISAVFSSRRTGNSYQQRDGGCTVVYATEFQGVAAGRVWGELTCPNAANPGGVDRACQAKASFRFENCAQ